MRNSWGPRGVNKIGGSSRARYAPQPPVIAHVGLLNMKIETEDLESLASLLTERIFDVVTYITSIRGKSMKNDFKKLTRLMEDNDQLWEWEWWGPTEPRNRYAMGWCVVRDGHAIASICHSDS